MKLIMNTLSLEVSDNLQNRSQEINMEHTFQVIAMVRYTLFTCPTGPHLRKKTKTKAVNSIYPEMLMG